MSYSIHRNFHRTSKFSSNLIVYLLFLFFAVSKKKKESLWNIFFLITQPFLYLEGLEGALKLISQEQFKNTTTKIFQVRQQFRGSTKISTHRIWHGEHINEKFLTQVEKYIYFCHNSGLNKKPGIWNRLDITILYTASLWIKNNNLPRRLLGTKE